MTLLPTATASALAAQGGPALVVFIEHCAALMDNAYNDLLAVSVVGSVAAGDMKPDSSDLDLMVVVERDRPPAEHQAVGERLADLAQTSCPLRGLEAVVYPRAVLQPPALPVPYALNVNAGPRMTRRVATAGDPAFWFLIDTSMARQHALTIAGEPLADVIWAPSADDVRAALGQSLRWHLEQGQPTANAVLNACRASAWLETGVWLSKTAAGNQALRRGGSAVIAGALAVRAGSSGVDLPADAVRAVQHGVLARLT